jgi:hypothetical protein
MAAATTAARLFRGMEALDLAVARLAMIAKLEGPAGELAKGGLEEIHDAPSVTPASACKSAIRGHLRLVDGEGGRHDQILRASDDLLEPDVAVYALGKDRLRLVWPDDEREVEGFEPARQLAHKLAASG